MKLDMTFHQTDQSFAAEFERLQAVCSVISVNGKTGAVQLTAEDVGALAQDAVQPGTIICTASDKIMKVEDSAEYALKGLTLYGKTTQNGTPAPDAPVALESVGNSGTINITVCGKNMFGGEVFANKLLELNPDKVTIDKDAKTVTYRPFNGLLFNSFKQNTQYTFFIYGYSKDQSDGNANLRVYYTDNTNESVRFNRDSIGVPHGKAFVSKKGKTIKRFALLYQSGITVLYYDKCGVFEGVLTEDEFEQYVEPQTLTASTPNGLNGIPVSSGGNYTDSNGQQWVCDEIDFAKGVYVQRIAKIDSYTGEAVGDAFLSTTGELSKGATVLYPLAEVLETALTEEELAQYTALHTYYPVTTVLNDGGAQMKLGYVADTKNYIDKKFIELQNAILSLGGNV